MTSRIGRKRILLLVLISSAIPSIILLGSTFGLSLSTSVPLIVLLSLAAGATALWVNANRHSNGSEWWQDDNADGWRGY
jgi:hypothetical protein